jgi:hypothetical protein
VGLLFHPGRPDALVHASSLELVAADRSGDREIYYAVGRSATVLMKQQNGKFRLSTNGLPESSILPVGSPPALNSQHWLTALPVLARPRSKTMLVIGLGGGVAVDGTPPSIESIDVVELEQRVIDANEAIHERRKQDPLADPRVRMIVNDARGALALTDKQYDIIVSQPSHPWTAGASHLYTREFMHMVREHLTDGGAFVQWIGWQFINADLLRTMAATLQEAFTHVRLYQHESTVLHFIASDDPLDIEERLARDGRPLTDHPAHYAAIGANNVEDIAFALMLDARGVEALARDAPVSTDNRNYLAMNPPDPGRIGTVDELFALTAGGDPFLDRSSWIYRDETLDLDRSYTLLRMLDAGFEQRVRLLLERTEDEVQRAVIEGLLADREGSIAALRRALALDPASEIARDHLVRLHLGSLAAGRAPDDIVELAGRCSDLGRAVIEGWGYAGRGDWTSLARLEEIFAGADSIDVWFPEATQLRAQWRTQVRDPQTRRDAAVEAIALLDRVLVTRPDANLYGLRISAAKNLGDAAAVVETCAIVGPMVESELLRAQKSTGGFSPGALGAGIQRVEWLLRSLSSQSVEGELEERAREVGEELQRLLTSLKSIG